MHYSFRVSTHCPASLGLVGRDDEWRQLEAAWARGAPLVELLGPGGIGKTRLARAWSGAREPSLPFVPLVAERTTDGMVQAIALGCGIELPAHATRTETLVALCRQLGGRSLVLDNLAQIDGASAVVRALVEAEVRVIVTSRAHVGVEGSRVIRPRPLTPPEATTLFVRRAAASWPDLSTDTGDLIELTELVDGLPLGIEIAASRAGLMTPAQITDSR